MRMKSNGYSELPASSARTIVRGLFNSPTSFLHQCQTSIKLEITSPAHHPTPGPGEPRMNAAYDFFIKEWYFSVPLVTMSLVAAALVIWRVLLNMTANTDMDEFL